MNGRVYNPVLGRFLSPDPIVQDVENSQSFNAFTYCLNNPLKYTDPTGYAYYYDPWTQQDGKYHSIEEQLWASNPDLLNDIYYQNALNNYFQRGGRSDPTQEKNEFRTSYISINGALVPILVPIVSKSTREDYPTVSLTGIAPKQDFSGFFGGLKYFFTGGNIGGYHYNPNGQVTGLAPITGMAPTPGFKGGYSVYQGIRNGEVVYWGLTNNIVRRTAEHTGRFDKIIEVFPNLTKNQARGLEQLMIDKYGIQNLENLRNGIDVGNSNMMQYFQDAVRFLLGL